MQSTIADSDIFVPSKLPISCQIISLSCLSVMIAPFWLKIVTGAGLDIPGSRFKHLLLPAV